MRFLPVFFDFATGTVAPVGAAVLTGPVSSAKGPALIVIADVVADSDRWRAAMAERLASERASELAP